MVTLAPGRRLLVPADRAPSRERLLATAPFFLRDLAQVPAEGPPRLLSFESDSFMDDFLATAAGKRPTLPRLLPWRDWSEPPAGLVDAHGLVAAEKATTPPWLRKLYLPLHERFNLISFDVVCAAAGWPRVARKRIKGSGAVIRRFIPGTASSPERWEDWIAVDERHGAWLPLLPTDLHTSASIDPARLPAPSATLELRLRSLLSLSATDPLPPLGLLSAPLALLPPDAGPAAQHCTLYGYLPVFSAAREVPTQLDAGDTPAAIATALSQRTLARLDSLFQSAAELRSAALPHLRSLLDSTVLPPRPADATAAALSGNLAASAPGGLGQVGNTLAHTIDKALLEALARLWQTLTSAATDDADIAGNVRSGTDLWAASTAAVAASAPGLFNNLPGVSPGAQAAAAAAWLSGPGSGAWDTLVRLRLHQLMDAWLAGTALPPPAQGNAGLVGTGHLAVVVVMALLRLRGCRLSLAARLNQALYNDPLAADLKAVAADGKRQMGLAALAELAETLLAQETARSDIQATPPWPPVPMPAQWVLDAHAHGEAIAKIYARFDDGLAAAGNAAVDQLAARIEAIETELDTAVAGLRAGLSLGAAQLGLNEQPPCGLLVLPGIRVAGTVLAGFRTAAAARYTAEPERLALPEARSGDALPRLRFDAEHLYAAWAWVRVAGHTPCEPERIVWTQRSEPFSIADPTDLLGARPASIQMPDIPKLLRDIPRIARARAKPFAGMAAPPGSGVITGADMADTRRDFGIGMICNFGIPVLTICALILFKIIFTVLITLPSFSWMLFLKFCLPFPKRGP